MQPLALFNSVWTPWPNSVPLTSWALVDEQWRPRIEKSAMNKSPNVKSPNKKKPYWRKIQKIVQTFDLSKPNHTQPNFNVQSYVLYALRLRRAVRTTLCPIFKFGTFLWGLFFVAPNFHQTNANLTARPQLFFGKKALLGWFRLTSKSNPTFSPIFRKNAVFYRKKKNSASVNIEKMQFYRRSIETTSGWIRKVKVTENVPSCSL